MGKKSRRPARQDKRTEKKPTLDDLDEHTAKPAPPLRAEEVYAKAYMARNPRPEDPSAYHTYTNGMIASWRGLSERDRRPYVSRASEMRRVFEETVAFCAKSGPALVGELFLDCPHGPRRQSVAEWAAEDAGLRVRARTEMRVVGLAETAWEASRRDKDVRVYFVEDEETRHKGLMSPGERKASASTISLRELRARACGDARAARKAARRSYEFVSRGGFDRETGTLFRNGRYISNDEYIPIMRAGGKVDLTPDDEYYKLVVVDKLQYEGLKGALKAIEKWPRIRPYWKRVRRRICANCYVQADLSQPRLWVCGGCGIARYCSAGCQREHWGFHQKICQCAEASGIEPRPLGT
jgi:hypothetical protein